MKLCIVVCDIEQIEYGVGDWIYPYRAWVLHIVGLAFFGLVWSGLVYFIW